MGNQLVIVNRTDISIVVVLEHIGPLHWQVLPRGHIWAVSPGQGFYTICARDARVEANHPTMLGAVGKPLLLTAGLVGGAALAGVAWTVAAAAVAAAEALEVAAITATSTGAMLSFGAAGTAGAVFGTSGVRYARSVSRAGVHIGAERVSWAVTSTMDERGQHVLSLVRLDEGCDPLGGTVEEATVQEVEEEDAEESVVSGLGGATPLRGEGEVDEKEACTEVTLVIMAEGGSGVARKEAGAPYVPSQRRVEDGFVAARTHGEDREDRTKRAAPSALAVVRTFGIRLVKLSR